MINNDRAVKNGFLNINPAEYTDDSYVSSFPCRKGDVFYILNTGYTSDPKPGRPAVIVSNEHLSQTSDWVNVVYMTTKQKRAMPEHVTLIQNDPKAPQSIVMCERISCISKNRIGQFMRHLSDDEIQRIDAALAISLGIGRNTAVKANQANTQPENADLKKELEFYKGMCDYLTSKLKGGAKATV